MINQKIALGHVPWVRVDSKKKMETLNACALFCSKNIEKRECIQSNLLLFYVVVLYRLIVGEKY